MTRESPFYEWLNGQPSPEEIAAQRAATLSQAERIIREREVKAYNGKLTMMSDAEMEREKQRVLLGI